MPKNVLLEICAVSVEYAVAAQRANAGRIELCTDLACGGVTPSVRFMGEARERLRLPVYVLIRPRPGDFVYSRQELHDMRQSIQDAKQTGVDGVVLGVLDEKSRINVARTRELVEHARPLGVTFHRAFDECDSWQDSLEAVIQTGADRLLTSGCRPTVPEGLSTIAQLIRNAKDRITVMPGSGITPENVVQIVRATGAHEIHASLLTSAFSPQEGEDEAQIEMYRQRVLSVTTQLQFHS